MIYPCLCSTGEFSLPAWRAALHYSAGCHGDGHLSIALHVGGVRQLVDGDSCVMDSLLLRLKCVLMRARLCFCLCVHLCV